MSRTLASSILLLLMLPAQAAPQAQNKANQDLFDKGIKHFTEHAYARAQKPFRELAEKEPDNPAVWLMLGRAYFGSGELAKSRTAFRRALELAPGDPAISLDLFGVLVRFGAREEARGVLIAATPKTAEIEQALAKAERDIAREKARYERIPVVHSRSPQLNIESAAGPGDPLYSETVIDPGQKSTRVAVLLSEAGIFHNQEALPAGTELSLVFLQVGSPLHYAGAAVGSPAACLDSAFEAGPLGGAKSFTCFQDLDGDGLFERTFVRGLRAIRDPPLVRYELRNRVDPVPDETTTFKGELVYQGAGGGILRLAYREYSNDMARPAFSQEVTYDLATEGPTSIVFKGAKIEILSAGNSGIRYVVTEAFSPK